MLKSLSKFKRQNKEKFKIPRCVQDTIPIDKVYKDGIFLSASVIPRPICSVTSTTLMLPGKTKRHLIGIWRNAQFP